MRESVEGTRRTIGERNSHTLDAESLLAACLAHDGELEEAEQRVRHVLEMRQDLPVGHPERVGTQRQLQTLLSLRRSLAQEEPGASQAPFSSSAE